MQDSIEPRCRRCRIPLGAFLCPNPACHERHGAQVGRLCEWCHAATQAHRAKHRRAE